MSSGQHDLGEIDEIDVEAIGEPGHRTFRLLLQSEATTAALWMEKEQLEQLAVVIEQQIARISPARPLATQPTLTLAARFPLNPNLDFKVGRMAVGFDADARRFVLTAQPLEESPNPGGSGGSSPLTPPGGSGGSGPLTPIELTCVVNQAQAEAISTKITTVAAAGRPRCPLCGAPMEGQHVCPISNGHVHV